MAELKAFLNNFNRKERYWLLRDAIEEPFSLSKEFRTKLKEEIGQDIPAGAWWAMDYHIDWLIAVLRTFPGEIQCETHFRNSLNNRKFKEIRGNQEDFDLVIAFRNTIILIEAKVGGFVNSQLDSKLSRLGDLKWTDGNPLIRKDGVTQNDIYIRFVLSSPKKKIDNLTFRMKEDNEWILKEKETFDLYHVKLPFPKKSFMVSRCDGKTWKKSAAGQHWAIYPVSTPSG